MGHIGPVNGYFTNPRDNSPPAPAPQNEYDALADLFLSHDEARTLLTKLAATPTQPTFASSEGGPALRLQNTEPLPLAEETPKPVRRVERVITGNLPIPASAWVAQYAKHIASTEHCTVGLVRQTEGVTTIELIRPTGSRQTLSSDTSHSLEDCIRRSSSEVHVWLVRTEGDHASHTSTTLLTGADDTSLVAAYRTLKSIATSNRRPALRVAIVGADDTKSKSAEDKLRRGSQTFLGITLDNVARLEKISPGSSVQVYQSTPNAHTPTDVFDVLHSTLEHSSVQPNTAAQNASPNKATQNQTSVAQTPSMAQPAESLSQDIPGLTRLPLTCPHAPTVEVAIELKPTIAHIHLLTSDTINGPSSLLLASNWIKANAQFLQLASPSTPLSPTDPILHIFTTDLKASRPLLDTTIRVQFVIEHECNGQTQRIVKQVN